MSVSPSVEHVVERLRALLDQLRVVVDARRTADPTLDDPFLGLYVSEERAERLLAGPHPTPPTPEAAARAHASDERGAEAGSRLHQLRLHFDLTDDEVDALVICLAPDVDARFEQLYGFCNDDVTLKRATVGLAIELLGSHPADVVRRHLFDAGGRLMGQELITFDSGARPFLSRSLVVPDRVTSFVLGGDDIDPLVAPVTVSPLPIVDDDAERLAKVLLEGVDLVHLVDPRGVGFEVLAGAASRLGRELVAVDLGLIASTADLDPIVRAAGREAQFSGGILAVGPIDAATDDERKLGSTLRCLTDRSCTVVSLGKTSWDPAWAQRVPLQITVDRHDREESAWQTVVPDLDGAAELLTDGQFRLRPNEIKRAAEAARLLSVWDGTEVSSAHVAAGARQQNGARLERLARRLEPRVGWDDLVLPELQLDSLRRLADRARHRMTVLGSWGMRPGGGRGLGVMGLFAGESGTGKTMSAEVIAGELGLDLYVVNLATVVDKYVGETEKNLDRIFSDADRVNGVLLFDEADALFGSRSEVRDSHDRYANLEIAYLLQRMESFDGMALLSTNLRSNLDDAFARRLDATIEFPVPGPDDRRRLWELTLAPLEIDDDVDLDFCSRAFELTGGNIRSAGISCGYAAAAGPGSVSMAILIRAIGDEYRKLGRLCLEAEFGQYLEMARP